MDVRIIFSTIFFILTQYSEVSAVTTLSIKIDYLYTPQYKSYSLWSGKLVCCKAHHQKAHHQNNPCRSPCYVWFEICYAYRNNAPCRAAIYSGEVTIQRNQTFSNIISNISNPVILNIPKWKSETVFYIYVHEARTTSNFIVRYTLGPNILPDRDTVGAGSHTYTHADLHTHAVLKIEYKIYTKHCNVPPNQHKICDDLDNLICAPHYYGNNCDRHCIARINERCDNNGNIRCIPQYYGHNCSIFCPKSPNGQCSQDGKLICKRPFYGPLCLNTCSVSSNGFCNATGSVICDENYYGTNCSKYCVNNRHGKCNSDGLLQCIPPHYGLTCNLICNVSSHGRCEANGTVVCHAQYYGNDCQNFCPTVPHGRCDSNGILHCFGQYTGQLCEKVCPIMSHGHCDTAGNVVCDTYYYGRNCGTFCKVYSKNAGYCDIQGNVHCNRPHYGQDCSHVCPVSAVNGEYHGTCDINGVLGCENGWTGPNCNVIDACSTAPCLNSGTCKIFPTGKGYQCYCTPEWIGYNCNKRNYCHGYPCIHGNCTVVNNSAHCRCSIPWSGPSCNNFDCLMHPCQHNGTCVTYNNKNICKCPFGWSGVMCETRIRNICNSYGWVCRNGGRCINVPSSRLYQCNCPPGFTGQRCEIRDRCYNIPCFHGNCKDGVCICNNHYVGPSCNILNACDGFPCFHGNCQLSSYQPKCHCQSGWSGVSCNKLDCNSCQNGATCGTSSEKHACICPVNWTGMFCENPFIVCQHVPSNTCNNGTCINNASVDVGFTCRCNKGWKGSRCNIPDPCKGMACHHGHCQTVFNSIVCLCDKHYKGDDCNTYDQCFSNPCQNGGTCNNVGDTYDCQCPVGWTGISCETHADLCILNSMQCLHNSTCYNDINEKQYGFRCSCTNGWTGNRCERDINECEISPGLCQHNGTCINMNGSYVCSCTESWKGTMCSSDVDECKYTECENDGTCKNSLGSFICICAAGYSGGNCEFDIDDCLHASCLNGGTCHDKINSYVCECPNDFSGSRCDIDLNPCRSDPCDNNSTCYNNNTNYLCSCSNGWQGETCSQDINECAYSRCFYNGTCINTNGRYYCICPSSATGKNCEEFVNDCRRLKCLNNGTCVYNVSNYQCHCSNGYSGERCETFIDPCLFNPCENAYSCESIGGMYKCYCKPGWTGENCDYAFNESTQIFPTANYATKTTQNTIVSSFVNILSLSPLQSQTDAFYASQNSFSVLIPTKAKFVSSLLPPEHIYTSTPPDFTETNYREESRSVESFKADSSSVILEHVTPAEPIESSFISVKHNFLTALSFTKQYTPKLEYHTTAFQLSTTEINILESSSHYDIPPGTSSARRISSVLTKQAMSNEPPLWMYSHLITPSSMSNAQSTSTNSKYDLSPTTSSQRSDVPLSYTKILLRFSGNLSKSKLPQVIAALKTLLNEGVCGADNVVIRNSSTVIAISNQESTFSVLLSCKTGKVTQDDINNKIETTPVARLNQMFPLPLVSKQHTTSVGPKSSDKDWMADNWKILVGACIGVTLVLIVIVVFQCRRRAKHGQQGTYLTADTTETTITHNNQLYEAFHENNLHLEENDKEDSVL